MTDTVYDVLLAVTAVGCGLVGGVFFTFSTFVTAALRRLPDAEGTRAMQAVNLTAVRPPLMGLLFGTAVLCLVAAGWSFGADAASWVLPAALVYLVGTIVVTAAANVPLNNRLAGVEAGTPAATSTWATYTRVWVRWNHVRTVAGAVSCGLFCLALLQR
ncbi:MAG: anthrone oxygenase family protein [Nocardioidaceae bacterium]